MLGFNAKTAEAYAEQLKREKTAIELAPELMLVAERQARSSHEGWVKGKKARGYIYGPKTNDDPNKGPLTNPLLLPYEDLPQEVKDSNIANAVTVLNILNKRGVKWVDFTKMVLYPIAKEIHDDWCREKLQNGWVWGPITDKEKKIHRDLVPFKTLVMNPDLRGDIQYDIDTAKQILIDMISNVDLFPIIPDLAILSSEVKN